MKTVLIIEDDPAYSLELEEELRSTYKVEKSVDAMNAVSKVYSINPDLVVLDVDLLGGMDGMGVLQTVRREKDLATTPIFVLTNLGLENKTRFIQAGATEYLMKSETSLETLKDIIDRYLQSPPALKSS